MKSFTVVSRMAHKSPETRVWRVNINGNYRWFDDIAKAYQYTLLCVKAKRSI